MLSSKLIQAFVFIAIGVAICSCGDGADNLYYKGVIINRAETEYKLGMIRIDDVFGEDDELESPARAIIYHVSENNKVMFDLQDTVLFNIGYEGAYQVAKNVTKDFSSIHQASNEDLYAILPSIQLNLHNADVHREGPKHTRRHIIQRITSRGEFKRSDGSNDVVYLIKTEKEFSRTPKELFVLKSDYYNNPTGIFFFNETQDSVISLNASQVVGVLCDMSATHDHTH